MHFNKRGQEISVNTLVLIVIAVLVLVFLIVGFAIGWKKIFPFITPGNNVKEVVDKCSLACNTQSVYDYCSAKREVRVDEAIISISPKKEFTATCKDLEAVNGLGVSPCASLQCSNYVYSSKAFAETALKASNSGCIIQDAQSSDAGAVAYADANGQTKYLKCAGTAE